MPGYDRPQQFTSFNPLPPGFTQDTRLLRLTTPLGVDVLLAECVRGEEAIDAGFSFVISALSSDARIPLRALLGQPALLELLTTNGRSALRPFHGHLTAVELAGANGGFARYHLTLEPWTSFLAHGRDSRMFHEMSVFDILNQVFSAYTGQAAVAPAWRFDLLDRDAYPLRSLTTQYQESDLAFAQRLMHEEGLFFYFEHTGAPATPCLGTHTLVVADHNGVFTPNDQPCIAFSKPGPTMIEDSLDRWRTETRMLANAVEVSSWDYRSRDDRGVASGSNGADRLSVRDVPGAYAYPSRVHGQRRADHLLQALEAEKEVHVGAGTVRTLAPGTTFTLTGHAGLDGISGSQARSFLTLRVTHLMNNNLGAELRRSVVAELGESALDAATAKATRSGLHPRDLRGERPVYRVRCDAIRSSTPYRSSGRDALDNALHPRPVIHGQQTAIVVGPAGATLHTDRDHRIKVQFHWQRGARSHNRLQHPGPARHEGAPADDSIAAWVRVATPLAPIAGANWGSNAMPRIGQEVLVDFLDGDIDRPVVLGALYNGRGRPDAQYNAVQVGGGATTGNAPAWFPGEAGGHAHPAALSGIKSQAMATSQEGSGAYSQLVFDDSPGQSRLVLQRHASAHKGTAELNLGHLRHQSDNQRLDTVGLGVELKAEHSAAVRAGKGLLLTTDARGDTDDSQMGSAAAVSQIERSVQLQASLTDLARKHGALGPATTATASPDHGELAATEALEQTIKVLQGHGPAAADGAEQAASDRAIAYSTPHLQLSSPAGIVAVSPANVVLAAGATSCMTAGQDINLVAQASMSTTVKNGISLFTYGKATNPDKPNQETGIRLHAASGKVSVQSQSASTRIVADKAITVASTGASVQICARQHVLLNAQGAQLKLSGGNIELHCPGKVEFKAGKKELSGPQSASLTSSAAPKGADIFNDAFVVKNEQTGEAMPNVPYRIESAGGLSIEGITDSLGRTQRLFTSKPEQLKLFLKDQD